MSIKITSQDVHADGTLMVPNRLGIKTNAPLYPLHVEGAIYASAYSFFPGGLAISSTQGFSFLENGAYVGNKAVTYDSNTNTVIFGGSNINTSLTALASLKFSINTNEYMRITSSGNVGIGTSSPSSVLDIVGQDAARFSGYQAFTTWRDTNDANKGFRIQTAGGNTLFAVDNTGGGTYTERMRITSSGNVGIGTSSPTTPLHVNGESRFANGAININSFGPLLNYSSLDNATRFGYIYHSGSGSYLEINNQQAGDIRLATNNSTKMLITSSGNVAIGSGTPGGFYKLEVSGNVFAAQSTSTEITVQSQSSHAYLIADSGSTSNANLILRRATVTRWYLANDSGTDRLYITDANANDGVYLAQNTQAWSSNSDSRLKDVQGTITNALDKVQQLTGVKFTWKRDADNPDAKVRVGLIAQDVQAVLPEAVDDDSPDLITDEETGRISGGLGVRYTELVPLLVNAIKELTDRVVTLEQAVA